MVEQWAENAYYQYFSGAVFFTPAHLARQVNLFIFGIRSEQKALNFVKVTSAR